MDGYKTKTVLLPQIDSAYLQLDTILLVPYTLNDSVTYRVSGAVTDTDDEGVRGAVVSITLSSATAAIFSIIDTTSQWGGYFSATTRQRYQPTPVTVRVIVHMPGFFPADIRQSLAASTQDFVINLVLRKNPASAMVPVRSLTRTIAVAARTYTINGRLLPTSLHRFAGTVIVRVRPDGSSRANIQLK
jgi:hypothetical protein